MTDNNSDDVSSIAAGNKVPQQNVQSANQFKSNKDSQPCIETELHRVDELISNITSQLKLLNDSPLSEAHIDLHKQPEANLLSYVKQLTATSTSQILDKLESLAPMIESSTTQCDELQEIIKTQPLMVLDSLEEKKSTEEKLLEGLGSQREALATLHEIHSDILLLHSFQDLVSQATIRAVDAVDVIRHDLNRVKSTLGLMQGIETSDGSLTDLESDNETQEVDSSSLEAQLGQNDVDSLFALIQENL